MPAVCRLFVLVRQPPSWFLAEKGDGSQMPNVQRDRGSWTGPERWADRLESSSPRRSCGQTGTGRLGSNPAHCPSLLPWSMSTCPAPSMPLQSPTQAIMLCLALNIALVPFVQLLVQTQKPHLYIPKTPASSLLFPADPLDNTALDRGILNLHCLFPGTFSFFTFLLVLPLNLVRVSRFPSGMEALGRQFISPSSPDPGYCSSFPGLSRKGLETRLCSVFLNASLESLHVEPGFP